MILASLTAFYLSVAAVAAVDSGDARSAALPAVNCDFETEGAIDGWTRRKGLAFPPYVAIGLDRSVAHSGGQSLHFEVNGGPVVMYSQPTRVDPLHSYVFHGYIRTQSLDHGAAVVSVSFLNYRRQRVQRVLTQPVGGTHENWIEVNIEPVTPHPDARFVVLGCHLLDGEKVDVSGSVWFDDLWLGKLPQLSLVSNSHRRFVETDAPLEVESTVSGLDPGSHYRLILEMTDIEGHVAASEAHALDPVAPQQDIDSLPSPPASIRWEAPPPEPGFYEVRSALERDGQVVLERRACFVVMDLLEQARPGGEFGWSVPTPADTIPTEKFIPIAKQAGINWIKYPLWESTHSEDRDLPVTIAKLVSGLNLEHVTTVGVLQEPPAALRDKFAKDWSGVSEIFMMPPTLWAPSLAPVIARYSSSVRYWQLGGERDGSFVGLENLPETLVSVKRELDRIGGDAVVGVPWNADKPLPPEAGMPPTFLSLEHVPKPADAKAGDESTALKRSQIPQWALIRPLPKSSFRSEERGADLVKRMVAAKVGGAPAIFADDVLDAETGLIEADGSPTQMYLPWRTTAAALRQAEVLGSLTLPGGSVNYAFARDREVMLVVWNDRAQTIDEEIYLGDDVVVTDIWGRTQRVDEGAYGLRLRVGSSPLFVHRCSDPIVRWRMAVRFERGHVRSAYESHTDAVIGKNTFSQGVTGSASLVAPGDWDVRPGRWSINAAAGEDFRHDLLVELPPNASVGTAPMAIDFDIMADRRYQFRVRLPYQVGLDDVVVRVVDRKLEDGRLEIEQVITNNNSPAEMLNFRCTLFVPGRKHQTFTVTKLGRGDDRKLHVLDDADSLSGKELWLRAEQVGGRRVLNYRWRVGENWAKP